MQQVLTDGKTTYRPFLTIVKTVTSIVSYYDGEEKVRIEKARPRHHVGSEYRTYKEARTVGLRMWAWMNNNNDEAFETGFVGS